jgi:hypothetical protein
LDQSELMNYVVDALDRHGVPYAITGSHASSVFGETRFTNDIDVVIQLNSQALLEELLTEFPEGVFYVSEIGARHAVAHGGQFNIIHEDSSQKVDLIIPERIDGPDQLARRTKVAVQSGRDIWFVSPEDLILKKMDFYREGGSEKHLRDIAGTLKISAGRVDLPYITMWAGQLGLSEIWNEILKRHFPV